MLLVAAPAFALEKVTLQLKWTHAFQFAGYYAALEKGYYREAGLDVAILEALPGIDPVNEVLSGKAQYGVGTSSLLLERKAGKPVVALAVIFQHSAYVLIARLQSATQGIHDLAGKRVMLEPQSDELLAYLQREGIPLDRIVRIEHSYDAQDMIDGKTDAMAAYVTNQPFDLDRAHFPYQIYTPRSAGIDFYGDTLFTREDELRKHRRRTEAFRAASLRGWEYAMAHPEEMIDTLLAKYSKRHGRDYFEFEARQTMALIHPELIEVGYMNPGRWRHIADTYAELGLLPAQFPLEGFLYEPESPLDWRRIAPYLLAGLALLLILALLAAYIATTNRKLRNSMAQLQRAQAAAEQMLVRRRQFVAMVSHEFRSPLAVIDNAAQLLALKLPTGSDVLPIVAKIRRGTSRLAVFLDNCLTEDRLDCEDRGNLHVAVDLVALVETAVDLCRVTSEQHTIVTEVQPGLPPMTGDPQLLRILLANLLGNAVKFSPPGSEIRLRIAFDGQTHRIEVIDQGAGIPADELPHVFEKYRRGRAVSSIPGAGLGLSLVANIVERHGGHIEIASEVGVGTRVVIAFLAESTAEPTHTPNLGQVP